ncbi:MAG: phosphoribosylformylglycinamidine synthase subunit PurS [Saprospiraceae bacterium]|jgi:phosphoribosylformylglycinamidine synthase
MQFTAEIDVMPHPQLLDPQGKTVLNNLSQLDLKGVVYVRIGRHITLQVDAGSETEAREIVEQACQKLLANPIVETYRFDLQAAS